MDNQKIWSVSFHSHTDGITNFCIFYSYEGARAEAQRWVEDSYGHEEWEWAGSFEATDGADRIIIEEEVVGE